MKRFLGFLLVGFAAFLLLGCVPPETTATTTTATGTSTETSTETLSLTLAQLAEFDGKNGKPAYIAVSGVIYDVSNSPRWTGGQHNGFLAGRDLTTQIQTLSPHGVSVLNGLPIIGVLVN
jgi:predicted heme/steroid binding protein